MTDEFVAAKMVRTKNVTQRINRIRSKCEAGGSIAKSRDEIEFNKELLVTCHEEGEEGEPFLIGITGGEDEHRVLTFGTEANVRYLGRFNRWFGDGTFKISPKIFKQIYTINIVWNGVTLPMSYSLLPNKQTESYLKMFRQIAEKLEPEDYPTHFSHDFELAPINAFKEVFGEEVIIEGSFKKIK